LDDGAVAGAVSQDAATSTRLASEPAGLAILKESTEEGGTLH